MRDSVTGFRLSKKTLLRNLWTLFPQTPISRGGVLLRAPRDRML